MKSRVIAVVVAVIVAGLASNPVDSNAASAVYSDTGTLGVSSGGTWADQLTFTDPNVTAKFTVTNTSYKAVLSDSTCMKTDLCGWWYVDDTTGANCYDSYSYVDADCDDETSLENSVLSYSPSSVSATEGVTWTWRANRCGNVSTDFPTPNNPLVSCPNASTVTIAFSAPVTNAIIHLNNVGGIGNFPTNRRNSLTTGFDLTLFSKWTLTSGQSMEMLSGGDTSNIMLDGNTIRNRYVPAGLGARVSNRECGYNEIACQYDNGTGSGSVLVFGTYSSLTFNIDLGWALRNYGPSNPAGLGTMNAWAPGSFDIPEGVSVQLSFYKSGPSVTTTTTSSSTSTTASTTTVASSTSVASTTTVPAATSTSSTSTSSTTARKVSRSSTKTTTTAAGQSELPSTGGRPAGGFVLGFALIALGAVLMIRRRLT